MRHFVIVLVLLFSSCVIDPTPGKVEAVLYTDSTDFTCVLLSKYKDDAVETMFNIGRLSADFNSWHSDVYNYSYTIDNNDQSISYFYIELHVTYPNEYEYKDIVLSDLP